MAGKVSSARVGAPVCGRGAPSPTQPDAAPDTAWATLYWPPEISRTEAMERIGEISASRRSTSRSMSPGAR